MIVYINNIDVPNANAMAQIEEGYTQCELFDINDNGASLRTETWTVNGFEGLIYDEETHVIPISILTKELLFEQAKALYDKLDAAGLLNEYKEETIIGSIVFVTMAENQQIDDTTAIEHISVFSPWEPNIDYKLNDIRRDNDKLYRCIQPHFAQEGWNPETVPALWARMGDPAEEWPEWSQPIGAVDAYMMGDKVSHNNKHWTSNCDNNVWEPGVYGWIEAIE